MAEYYPSEGIEQVLKNQSAYYNELDLSSFSAIFGNVSESYKFYWTEAISDFYLGSGRTIHPES